MKPVRIFISYSWDSTEHCDWVRKLADTLEEIEEIHVTWDGYDLDSLVDKNYFMEAGINDADLILIVATKNYQKKANDRSGGVGLETFMTSAVHWDGMLRDKKSRLIIIKREDDSTPQYLNGHLYLDFFNEAVYEKSVSKLVSLIRGESTVPRPKKRTSLTKKEHIYNFTRVEDIIRVNHPNRRALVSMSAGTDYSGSNRIKYELWETKSPALGYFLALHANINIAQTTRHAISSLVAAKIRPKDIIVLRQRNARPEQELIASIFADMKFPTKIHECTYKEYIWDYCIDEELKTIDPPMRIENYTHQSLKFLDSSTNAELRADSALTHIVEALQSSPGISTHLVTAPGGMGKTFLCLSVAKKLHFQESLRSSVILIQAESIRRYIADKGVFQSRINSIYDIYKLYAKYQGHSKVFERLTFDLAVACGNLTIIIDGLDELSSLFQDKFDVTAFLASLKEIHDQLGSSNILLTSRNSIISSDVKLENVAVAKYELLGFDTETCKKYVAKRLNDYSQGNKLVKRVMKQIAKVRLSDGERRIIPFLADIATTVVEDELKEGNGQDFELSEDLTPYPSNNELTDHIVHSILRREETRHELDITVTEVMEIISGLVADFGKRWPVKEMRERIQLLYEVRSKSIFSKLSLNPLLLMRNDDFELRYSFLSSYFETLFILQGILKSSLESERIRSLARLGPESQEARELRRYSLNHLPSIENALKALIPKLRDRAISPDITKISSKDCENAKGAIASLLQLYFGAQNHSIDTIAEKLLSFYGIKGDATTVRTLNGLFLNGEFPPFNFSNLTITNSRFQSYKNLVNSRFSNCKFMYSVFQDCGKFDFSNLSLEPEMIDSTCEAGDLGQAFALASSNKSDKLAIVQRDAKRFLHSFFRGDRFVDNKTEHIKFSTKVPGLAPDKFDRLLSEGYITLGKVKTVAKFYEIADNFKPSVRKYLVDGYPEAKIKKFIVFIQ